MAIQGSRELSEFCRVLDFKKIKQKEREAAKSLYKSKEGKTQLKDIQRKAKTFVPGEPLPEATNKNTNAAGLTPDQVKMLRSRGQHFNSLSSFCRCDRSR